MTTTPATVEGLMDVIHEAVPGRLPASDLENIRAYAKRLAAQPSDASAVLAAEQFPLPPAKVQAYADTNGLPTADVKACESCPTCGAPVTVFQPKVGEPIYTHKPADGVDLPDGGQHG
jgi:hypothetical protein